MNAFHLALIDTSGKQDYIFQSNKLRQAVGGSELIRRVGTTFVDEAIARGGFAGAVEAVIATSGKAVIRAENRQDAEEVVWRVTRRALDEAPGLGVFGAVSPTALKHDAPAADAHAMMKALTAGVARNRRQLSAPQARFPFQPVVRPCNTSGLPAEDPFRDPEQQDISASAYRKSKHGREKAVERLNGLFRENPICDDPEFLDNMNLDWWAVVHADGNGFGKVFMNLDTYLPKDASASDYLAFYRGLSEALDKVGEEAVKAAAGCLKAREFVAESGERESRRPLVPLVMGGDDLTVICDGAQAVAFARAYVAAFEDLVDNDFIGSLRNQGLRFGAAAGIAIVKPHHPFRRAYALAEELTKSAKASKAKLGPAASSLDYQVVFGDTTSSLESLRARWQVDDTGTLTARPYVLSEPNRFNGSDHDWAEPRRFDALDHAIKQLITQVRDPDGDVRLALPRAQQHALRDVLFDGRDAANARLNLIAHRYDKVKFCAFGDGDSLFFSEERDGKRTHATRLIDAMELVDIGAPSDRNDNAPSNRDDNAPSAEPGTVAA